MASGFNRLYEFGEFQLDADKGTLRRGYDLVSLSPKSVELLVFLVERDGETVSKKEIFDNVWAKTFVEDGVLTQNIYTLRNALGLDANGKQFIETVPRRGYRFAAAVRPSSDGGKVALDVDDAFLKAFAGSPNRSLYRAILATLAIIASVGVLWFGIYELFLRPKPPTKAAPIEQVRFQRLTDTGDVLYPTISPDGETLAFVRSSENEQSVWVQQTATGSSMQVLPPSKKGYASLAFSPDGRYLFFRESSDGGSIFQVSTFGGSPRKVAENSWSDLSLSPDGKQAAFTRHDTIRNADLLIACNLDGSGEKELAVRQSPSEFTAGPAWSPDGGKIVVTAHDGQDDYVRLIAVDAASGEQEQLKSPKWRFVASLLWIPNGKSLVVSAREMREASSQLWIIATADGEARRLTNDLENYFWVSRTADGQKIVTRQQHIVSHLWLIPSGDVKKARQLTSGVRNLDGYAGLAWTADGRIVFSSRSGQVTDLYSMDPNGGDPVELTANTGQDNTYPSVSPNGQVIFTSNRGGLAQIWQMNPDGREQHQLAAGSDAERIQSPTYSSDGKEIFFLRRADTSAIWKIPAGGGDPALATRISNGSADGPLSVSPDGKWLAYHHLSGARGLPAGDDRTQQIGVIRLDGTGETKLFDLPVRRPIIQWTTDDSFDYSAGSYNASSLVRQTLTGDGHKLFELPDRIFNFAWSNDGKSLVISRGQLQGDAILITNLLD